MKILLVLLFFSPWWANSSWKILYCDHSKRAFPKLFSFYWPPKKRQLFVLLLCNM